MNRTNEQRTADEDAHKRIEALLENEEDPKERARLLVLLRLNDVLVDNVVATRDLTTEFKEHRSEFGEHIRVEEAMVNRGRGAVWGALALIGIVQILGGYIVTRSLDDLKEVLVVATDNRIAIESHKETHKDVERRLDVLERHSPR